MKYTKEQLEAMSDFEITAIVMQRRGWLVKTELEGSTIGFNKEFHERYPSTVWCAPTDGFGNQIDSWEQINCCLCWSDIGPIIPSISEDLFSKPDWCLLNKNLWDYFTDLCDGNMCRAAAIVYLLVGE